MRISQLQRLSVSVESFFASLFVLLSQLVDSLLLLLSHFLDSLANVGVDCRLLTATQGINADSDVHTATVVFKSLGRLGILCFKFLEILVLFGIGLTSLCFFDANSLVVFKNPQLLSVLFHGDVFFTVDDFDLHPGSHIATKRISA